MASWKTDVARFFRKEMTNSFGGVNRRSLVDLILKGWLEFLEFIQNGERELV
jgi:hypothetical protein